MEEKDRDAERARLLRRALRDGRRPGLEALAKALPLEWLPRSSTGFDGVVRFAPFAGRPGGVGEPADAVTLAGGARTPAGGAATPAGASAQAASGGLTTASGRPDAAAVALHEVLCASGMPEQLASTCAVVLPAITRLVTQGADGFLRPSEAIAVVEEAAAMTSLLEACRMLAARDLAVEAGTVVLAKKGVESADELARTVRESWEATCRAVAAEELAAVTGRGRWHTREAAAIGLAPPPLLEHVLTGLRSGVARWSLVTAFWRRCWSNKRISSKAATEIAAALFGDELDRVVVERITPDGELSLAPWADKQFHQALEREATRREAQDPEATAAERAEQHRRRNAFGWVDDDGSGQVVISGDAASVSACVDRLHVLARRARAAGDDRTEQQLRSDIARSLLLHGVLPMPDLGDEAGVITPDQVEGLVQVLAGAPSYELQVVVPWDALSGHALVTGPGRNTDVNSPRGAVNPVYDISGPDRACGAACGASSPPVDPACASPPGDPACPPSGGSSRPPSGGSGCAPPGDPACAQPGGSGCASPGDPACAQPGGSGCAHPGDHARAPREKCPGALTPDPAASDGVGRTLGRFPRFLTKTEILAIAGGHGVTLSRLLVDPADGRCIERSIATYRPDAAMRAQIRAADVFSRFPGSTLPVRDGDLDHVIPYLLGGPTAEVNLQGLDRTGHVLKTVEHWKAQMDATRNVTWTSFFGRLYTTRTHDYRQYLSTASAAPGATTGRSPGLSDPAVNPALDPAMDPAPDRRDERHLASLLVYAALCARAGGASLKKPGDDPTSDEWLVDDSYRAIWVRHTRPDGKKVPGPRPGTPAPEQLITVDPRAVLDADHWTDVFVGGGGMPQRDEGSGGADAQGEEDAPGGGDGGGDGRGGGNRSADALGREHGPAGERDPGGEDGPGGGNWSSDDPIPF